MIPESTLAQRLVRAKRKIKQAGIPYQIPDPDVLPERLNAALASEALGDLPIALGAMRSYLHLARNENEVHLRRARAALWEWESRLRPSPAGAASAASGAR